MSLEKIKEFIEDNPNHFDLNNLQNATSVDSSINGMCVILAGYCLYLNGNSSFCNDEANYLETVLNFSDASIKEFRRVYDYAYGNEYVHYWLKPEAKATYKF